MKERRGGKWQEGKGKIKGGLGEREQCTIKGDGKDRQRRTRNGQ